MSSKYLDLLDLAPDLGEIAQEAGNGIMQIYGESDFVIETKADQSPLTLADKASNALILSGLAKLHKKYHVLSEESKSIPFSERTNFDRFWLVDPLDGTKEFIKRNGEFTVNIALIEKGSPVMGVVYVPVREELYWAVKGEGAYLEKGDTRMRLQANSFRMSDPGLRVVCSRSHLNPETQAFIDQLNSPVKVNTGSSLKFLLLAAGEADLYPRVAPTMEWDTAAAHCILLEAGGKVVQYGTDAPLIYNKEDLRNPHFLATGTVSA